MKGDVSPLSPPIEMTTEFVPELFWFGARRGEAERIISIYIQAAQLLPAIVSEISLFLILKQKPVELTIMTRSKLLGGSWGGVRGPETAK